MISNLVNLFLDPDALAAMLKWPKFSLTSYKMVTALKKQGLRPKTIIDVGANVGQFGIACSKIFADSKVYSFEPNPEAFAELEKNSAKVHNLSVFDKALGNVPGTAEFFVNSHSHSSSLLELGEKHKQAFPQAMESQTIKVDVSTLDDVAQLLDFNDPVLLKLDVQGFEFQVIEGAKNVLNKINYIIMELSYTPMYEGEKPYNEVVEQMQHLGFKALRPVGLLTDPKTEEILQMDWLFERISSV